MNGNEVYENNFKNKINNIINSNPDKPYLRGYANFIGKSKSTVYNYLNYVVGFMNYTNKDVRELELDDYTNYLSNIEDKSSAYRIAVYSSLKKFSKYLNASNKNENNPMEFIDRPKFLESENTKIKREKGYLEAKEIKKYIGAVEKGVGNHNALVKQCKWKSRDKAIILLFLNTGIRCSELYKLNIDSIDFEDKKIITIGKGGLYKERPISDDVIRELNIWINDRNKFLNGIKENALFISNRRERMTQCSIGNIVKKYASIIEGKNITPHKLRATYGTQLYAKTGDLYMVQECMGHSNPKTTELYIRGQKNQVTKTASDIMSKLIF